MTSHALNARPWGLSAGSLYAAVVLYFMMLWMFAGIGVPDAKGIGPEITNWFTTALWIAVAVYAVSAAWQARLSGGSFLFILIIVTVSAFVSMWYVSLARELEWILIAPIVLPLLSIASVFGMRSITDPKGRRRFGFAMGAMALLFWMPTLADARQEQVKQVAYAKERAARLDRQVADAEAEFTRRLKPESHLADLLPYLEDEPYYVEKGWSRRALAAIQRLPSRQADAIQLIEEGMPLEDLTGLHQYNLEPTPELCRSYRTALIRLIDDTSRLDLAWQLEQQVPNLRWFSRNGCDLSEAASRGGSKLGVGSSSPYHQQVAQEVKTIGLRPE